ncbi:MAG TPA: hypothetical protein VIL72_03195 [Beijerinckiaceae bacterium]|jgi:hypothetical protein
MKDQGRVAPPRGSSRRGMKVFAVVALLVAAISAGFLLYSGDNFNEPQSVAVQSGGQAGSGPPLADPDRPPEGRMTHPPR